MVSAPVKGLLLGVLIFQNGALNVLARWSRAGAGPGAAKTSVIVVCEVVKALLSLVLLAAEQGLSLAGACAELVKATRGEPREAAKLLIPSALYVVQNNLLLVGADNLEAPVLAVFSQAKILTTAVFSIALLGKELDLPRWVALLALMMGVSTVQLSQLNPKAGEGDEGSRNLPLGLAAISVSCCTSGLAGVYFEKVLKGSAISLWIRNIHLAVIGVFVGVATVFASEADIVSERGFLAGFGPVVWGFVAVQAGGGLLVAAVIKFTDNIIKGFGAAGGIIFTSIISMLFFNFPARPLFFLGVAGVVYSILLYGDMLKELPACQRCPRWLGGPSSESLGGAAAKAPREMVGAARIGAKMQEEGAEDGEQSPVHGDATDEEIHSDSQLLPGGISPQGRGSRASLPANEPKEP